MKVEIIKIIDRGLANMERLHLRVMADVDLVYFMVVDGIYLNPNEISSEVKNTHWFIPKKVKAGDYIVLYTCKGKPSTTKNNDGSTTHFFYWGLDKTLWNKPTDCAIVFELNNWQTSKL